MLSDMEAKIHLIEREAYTSILRAFISQSDALTWEKESLITELRKELRVSDEEHRELISLVNSDDFIRSVREWRNLNGLQPGPCDGHPSINLVPNWMPLASRKKQKTSHSVAYKPDGPSPTFHHPIQPSSLALNGSTFSGVRGRKLESYSLSKPTQTPFRGFDRRFQVERRASSVAFGVPEAVGGPGFKSLVGKKVWTRWPEDNNFYEAVITAYDPVEGRHALVYDKDTANEACEWINLMEMSPEDIRWEYNDAARTSHSGGHGELGRGFKKPMSSGGGSRRDPCFEQSQSVKHFFLSQNGFVKNPSSKIEILHTGNLIMEVERVFSAGHLNTAYLERVKKVLNDHEQALLEAIKMLDHEIYG